MVKMIGWRTHLWGCPLGNPGSATALIYVNVSNVNNLFQQSQGISKLLLVLQHICFGLLVMAAVYV